MDLKHQLIMEMVITGFCGEFQNTLEECGISYSGEWRTEDLDPWFHTDNRLWMISSIV